MCLSTYILCVHNEFVLPDIDLDIHRLQLIQGCLCMQISPHSRSARHHYSITRYTHSCNIEYSILDKHNTLMLKKTIQNATSYLELFSHFALKYILDI